MANIEQKQDRFANIAALGIGGAPGSLIDPQPVKIKHNYAEIKMEKAVPFSHKFHMHGEDELKAELGKMRKAFAPFLENRTRAVRTTREKIEITKFMLDGKEVTLPHYGYPVGNARQDYRTFVTLDKLPENGERMILRFNGVDYIATVYVNGEFVGSHEGFFSPFEFDVTREIKTGENEIRVVVDNDYIFMGNDASQGGHIEGDKMYAATGLGWDDHAMGWHHCPPGMGIHGKVWLEKRPRVYISDLAVRPITADCKCEIIAEVTKAGYGEEDILFNYEIEGKNFESETVSGSYAPVTYLTVGRGDSLTEANLHDRLAKPIPLKLQHGINVFKFTVDLGDFKTWDITSPFLYEARVAVISGGSEIDEDATAFGMRSFTQDVESSPKGMFYLNGRPIRLRGANTMGFEQRDVQEGNIDQLIDDILYARICNMNYLRITQRPVQKEVYDICDRLGMLIQTDLPLFGCMRRTKFCEGVRQAEEMERIIRPHACCILVTYINEPFPNANNAPHRHLERSELQAFFNSCDTVVHLQNPDRVTKHIDGDYDPPCDSMPDNHCYPMWYNGHGIDIGRLHRGYWLGVRPDWYYGCGEYGSEGLDSAEVMDRYYPAEWLTEPFDPGRITRAQTGMFHAFFYDRQNTREDWIRESQIWQATSAKMMTEAFRRNNSMVSNAIHLFIDAWPAGWMKSIMDCNRHPKMAYFAYRDALEPVHISLRTDRYTYYCGEDVKIEAWLCNDTVKSEDMSIRFELYRDGEIVGTSSSSAEMKTCSAHYSATARFTAPDCSDRAKYKLKAILLDTNGGYVTYTEENIEVFRHVEIPENGNVTLIEKPSVGEHEIDGCKVRVKACSMLPLHFASRATGHDAVFGFEPNDFRFWYNGKEDCITPILDATFTADGFEPVLLSGNTNDEGKWTSVLAAAERTDENGHRTVITTLDLRRENPIAERFLAAIYRK